jgi:hypothetical protein
MDPLFSGATFLAAAAPAWHASRPSPPDGHTSTSPSTVGHEDPEIPDPWDRVLLPALCKALDIAPTPASPADPINPPRPHPPLGAGPPRPANDAPGPSSLPDPSGVARFEEYLVNEALLSLRLGDLAPAGWDMGAWTQPWALASLRTAESV